MRTNWDAAAQGWGVYIDDRRDSALLEFDFPDSVHSWLTEPAPSILELAAVAEPVSPVFAARLRGFLARGQIQEVCHADAARGSTLRRPRLVRPGDGELSRLVSAICRVRY